MGYVTTWRAGFESNEHCHMRQHISLSLSLSLYSCSPEDEPEDLITDLVRLHILTIGLLAGKLHRF